MYFVTMGKPGYVLFSTTPQGRAAIGLTETGVVRLLAPGDQKGEWRTLREWPTRAYSHTDLFVMLGGMAEPERAEDLLASLPRETLS
ncbi:MAG TPA: hypothetical protein VFD92_06365 [Candidatus Binatia bacterium]|nr:hypothetical protein [Candidatus Binatia bacterium]